MKRATLWLWGRILVSGTVLGLVLLWMRRDIGRAWHLFAHVSWWAVAAATGLYVLAVVLASERLRQILSAYGIRLSLAVTTRLSMIGLFFNNVLPTGLGGDVVKAHCASRLSRRSAESYVAVLVDRLVGLTTIVGLATLAAVLSRHVRLNRWALLCGVLGVLGGLWLAWQAASRYAPRAIDAAMRRWHGLARISPLVRLAEALRARIFTTRRTLGVLGVSLALQLLIIVSVFVLARGLALPISLWQLLVVTPLIWSAAMVPSINGLGLREGAFVFFLGDSAGKDGAFALSMLWLAVITAVSLLGAPAYWMTNGARNHGGEQ